MALEVVKYADEVDEAYIRKVLKEVYGGRDYHKQFSDKLVRVFLSDYKRKAKNLAWFMKDKDGRVRNYIEMTPSPEKSLEDAIKNNSTVAEIAKYLDNEGISYTAESFLENKCIFEKQPMKITKVIKNRKGISYEKAINFTTKKVKDGVKVSFKAFGIPSSGVKDYYETGVIAFFSDGSISKKISSGDVVVSVKDRLSDLSENDLANVFNNINSADMKVSMDLADIATCSTGNCGSCFSVDNIHHNAALMYFRSDFALIAFTHDNKDRLLKRGRSWLFLRFTKDGAPSNLPFFKQQTAYGSVSSSHQSLLTETIKNSAKKELNITEEIQSIDQSINVVHASPNSKPTSGHTAAPGYLDGNGGGRYSWHIPKSFVNTFHNGAIAPLVFPDPLDTDGNVTSQTSFGKSGGNSGYYRPMDDEILEVVCAGSNEPVLSLDALKIGDDWYSKAFLKSTLGTAEVSSEAKPAIKAKAETIEEEELNFDDTDIEDF